MQSGFRVLRPGQYLNTASGVQILSTHVHHDTCLSEGGDGFASQMLQWMWHPYYHPWHSCLSCDYRYQAIECAPRHS